MGAYAGKPVPTFNIVRTGVDEISAKFDLVWSKYPVYRADVYLRGHLTETTIGGYIIDKVSVLNDNKVHRTFSLTGSTVAFG